jgi:tetratricopeptide (TPR) repeat protein
MATTAELEALGNQAMDEGRFADARKLFERGAARARTDTPQDYNRIAILLNNAGFACRMSGNLDDAEAHYKESLAVRSKLGIQDDPEAAITLHHLGRVAYLRRDFQTAYRLWQDELNLWIRLIKDESMGGYIPYLATCLHAIGVLKADTKLYNGARQDMEQALTLLQNMMPPDYPELVETAADLGQLCAHLGDLAAARRYLHMALPQHTVDLGSDHPRVKELRQLLADVETRLAKLQ